jgi:hypothetical protein
MSQETSEAREREPLMVAWTGEPVQPVRLYYSIPSRGFVTARLAQLRCMGEERAHRAWVWLYQEEASALKFFEKGIDEIPAELQPIVLGRIRFPASDRMTLQFNSTQRALIAVQFFAPYFGPKVALKRGRLVNRFFAAREGPLDRVSAQLDQDVTVIDPDVAARQIRESFGGRRGSSILSSCRQRCTKSWSKEGISRWWRTSPCIRRKRRLPSITWG